MELRIAKFKSIFSLSVQDAKHFNHKCNSKLLQTLLSAASVLGRLEQQETVGGRDHFLQKFLLFLIKLQCCLLQLIFQKEELLSRLFILKTE